MADEQATYEAGPSEYAAQDDDGSVQSEGEVASEKDMILEQDRLLPLANIGRIMKNVLPSTGKLSKEAKETMQECISEFLLFVASEASDLCTARLIQDSRKTLSGDDIIHALAKLGFDNYVNPAAAYLRKYREATNGKTADGLTIGQPTGPTAAVYAAMPGTVEYTAETSRSQHHPQHPQHVQHVQHHVMTAGGSSQHPHAIPLPPHLLQQQQYIPHPQQFQPLVYPVGGQHAQPPMVAGAVVDNPAAVIGSPSYPLVVSEQSAFQVVNAAPQDYSVLTAVGELVAMANSSDPSSANPSSSMFPADGAAPGPDLREVHPPVQVFHDSRTNLHYLRVSDDKYVPIAFLSNEGAPPQFDAADQPSSSSSMSSSAVGHPSPAKVSRMSGTSGRSQRGGGRGGRNNVADAGPEQSVGSFLRRQQEELNPKKRAAK